MLDIYQFDLKPLKRYFNIFATSAISISLVICLATYLLPVIPSLMAFYSKYLWYFFAAFVIFNFAFEGMNKKESSKLADSEDFQEKVIIYNGVYKRKLALNLVSVIISGFFLFLSHKTLFLIILTIQLVLLPIFYPRPEKITKALKNDEILFT